MAFLRLKWIMKTAMPVIVCALVLLATNTGMAQSTRSAFISDTVATVNGQEITESELMFNLMRMFGEDTVYDLIEDEVIVSQAAQLNVSLDANEVVEYLSGAYAPEKLASLIDAFGEDLLNHAVGNQLLALKTVTAKIDQIVAEFGIEVSDEQVRDYYLDNIQYWVTPAQVRFSLIETSTEAEAQAARNRILAGEDFGAVCREVSTHEGTRIYDGDIGGLVPEGYSSGEKAVLEQAAFDLEINEVSAPLSVEDKWYLVMPTEKTEYREEPLEEVRDDIHAVLVDQLVEPHLEDWLDSLFENAEIEILYPILLDPLPASFTPGEEGSFIAPTIARVNGRDIPEGALFFHLLRQYGSDVIKVIIEEILYVQQAPALGVTLSQDEIARELADTYEPDVLSILNTAFGSDTVNNAMMRHLVALEVLGVKYQEIIDQQDIEITEEEVTSYYLENLPNWVMPDLVRFSMLVVETEEEARAARERIEAGESFSAVCREVSVEENTREYGGDIGGPLPRGFASGENVAIENAAFMLPIEAVSQPIQVGGRWFLIKVTDRSEAYEPTLGEMREDIYAELLQNRVSPFLTGWRSELWESADITVVYPIFSDTPSPDFSSEGDMLPGI